MRDFTEEEKATRDRRVAAFERFFEESVPVLVDFAERLELPEPHLVVRDASRYLGPIDEWMKPQLIDPEDRVWILTRIGHFIGELLTQRFGGHWYLDEDPESPYFLHYVVGRFSRLSNPDQKVSPFAIAGYYVSQPAGRSLRDVVDRTINSLNQ